jgi:hypothetical protein
MPVRHAGHKLLQLPPGFTALEAARPWEAALVLAKSDGPPGTLLHAPFGGLLEAALVLCPDQPVGDETVMRLATLAVHEALVALVPPESTVAVLCPGVLAVNRGELTTMAVARGPELADGAPAWMVLGLTLRVALHLDAPGQTAWLTDLAEEGVDIAAPALLESVCRHLLAWFNTWQDEGDAAIAQAWRVARTLQHA